MSSYEEIYKELEGALELRLRQIMEMDSEGQKETLRIMFMTFVKIGRERNLPIMQDVIIKFIRSDYPHLQDDMNKLLLLL